MARNGGGIRAADEGFDVIMSPNSSLYFDYYQSANIDTEPPTIGGYIPLKKVYDTEPVPEELTPEQARHIIGVQANVWTTYMRTDTILEHMLLPRLAALAERAWSDREKDFTDFMERLDRLVGFYDRDGYSHFPYFYDITGAFTADYGRKAVGMTLSSLPGADIRYTLDGSEPTEESPLCTDTVWIGSPTAVRAVAVLPDGRRSEPFREEVTFNKATMKPIRLLTARHPKYAARRAQRRPAGQAGLHLRQLGGLAGRRHGGRDRPRTAGGDRAGGVQRPAGLRVAHHGRRRSEGMGFGRRRNIPRGIRRALSGNSLRCRQTHFAPRSELLPGAPGPLRETAGPCAPNSFPKLISTGICVRFCLSTKFTYISSMDTRGFKLCAAAVGILPVTAGCTDRAPQEHPNILFILSDDHTSQSWGIYGGILAPYAANDNIARLAAEGCVLDNAFCTNSISVPSRAAILTGQYSHLNGVYTLDDALRPEQDNIAKRLQQAGYRTALVGK